MVIRNACEISFEMNQSKTKAYPCCPWEYDLLASIFIQIMEQILRKDCTTLEQFKIENFVSTCVCACVMCGVWCVMCGVVWCDVI